MELYATHSDPLNTELLDSHQRPLYRVKTHYSVLKGSTVTITKSLPNGQEETFAEIEWRSWSKDILRFKGTSMNLKDFITRASRFGSSSQQFASASGRQYAWKHDVLNDQEGIEVGRWHHKSMGILGNVHPAYLQISERTVEDADEIMVAHVYNQALIQRQRTFTIAATSNLNGAAAAAAAAAPRG